MKSDPEFVFSCFCPQLMTENNLSGLSFSLGWVFRCLSDCTDVRQDSGLGLCGSGGTCVLLKVPLFVLQI